MMDLTACQTRALGEIMAAYDRGGEHLLTGYAGSGKTTLMREVAQAFLDRRREVVVSAPTHKAVSVLATKIPEGVGCMTIHALLSLKPTPDGARTVLKRNRAARPITAAAVIIDECSMLGTELMTWIRKLLPHVFVLFVGDPAQLPPVNEPESEAFSIQSTSHLDTIVRQAQGNPVLDAAHAIRKCQGGSMDWSWAKPARAANLGVFVPFKGQIWMRQAFTSERFRADNDQFRYLCWTNERVAEVNARVRRWIYGDDTPTPFMPGERVLLRAPVMQDDTVLLATNEEAEVISIGESVFEHVFHQRDHVDGWTATLSSWRAVLRGKSGLDIPVQMVRDPDDLVAVDGRLLREGKLHPSRWFDRFVFKQSLAQMQAVYALTVHTSQGSTFGHAFVDVGDIRRRERSNLLEMQQLLYVAATRPSQALVLVGMGQAA